eukprot:TRINITY_DN7290_c0_g1_i3.p1 TRINITY_DN7290_c0_g1~~TRINITY_DN7290_c0_g1_i3.p1  ORF type:complete len:611 (+),score=201.12 TRINITY_DN7290_c0_g1_i3:248-2080(+)
MAHEIDPQSAETIRAPGLRRDPSEQNNTADQLSSNDTKLKKRRKSSRLRVKQRVASRLERLRRNSKIRKLPKHTTGSTWHTIMKTPVQILNKQFSSRLNLIFLSLEASWKYLLLTYFAFVFILALILGGLFEAASCSADYSFARIYLLVVQQLMTGPALLELLDRETEDLSHGCILLGFVTSTCTLFLQAFILSMAVRKFMKPKAAVAFSRKLCFNSRNAVPCLQTRVFNLRGNLISDIEIKAVYSFKRTTAEGETHWQVQDLTFKGPQFVKFPVTYTHYIDESSPLFKPYFTDRHIEGRIFIELVGYDHVLSEEVHANWVFDLPADAALYCRFADMVVKSFQEAVSDGSYQCAVTMDHFDAVEPVPAAEEMLSKLTQGVCPFAAHDPNNLASAGVNRLAVARLSQAAAQLDTPKSQRRSTMLNEASLDRVDEGGDDDDDNDGHDDNDDSGDRKNGPECAGEGKSTVNNTNTANRASHSGLSTVPNLLADKAKSRSDSTSLALDGNGTAETHPVTAETVVHNVQADAHAVENNDSANTADNADSADNGDTHDDDADNADNAMNREDGDGGQSPRRAPRLSELDTRGDGDEASAIVVQHTSMHVDLNEDMV